MDNNSVEKEQADNSHSKNHLLFLEVGNEMRDEGCKKESGKE